MNVKTQEDLVHDCGQTDLHAKEIRKEPTYGGEEIMRILHFVPSLRGSVQMVVGSLMKLNAWEDGDQANEACSTRHAVDIQYGTLSDGCVDFMEE